MSALDQAFIKAYAKEMHAAPAASPTVREPSAEAMPAHSGEVVETAAPRAAVEQLYDNALFYRLEPASGAPARPHFAPAERKTPRRLQRRGAVPRSYDLEPEPATDSSSNSAAPRREIRRPQNALRSLLKYLAEVDVPELPPQVELAPETAAPQPLDKPQPSAPPAPPFTQNREDTQVATWSASAAALAANAMAVQGHWDAGEQAPVAPPVMLIHGIAPKQAAQAVTVDIRLPQPLPGRAGDPRDAVQAEATQAEPGRRSQREGRRFRLDAGHAAPAPHKPKSTRPRDESPRPSPASVTTEDQSAVTPAPSNDLTSATTPTVPPPPTLQTPAATQTAPAAAVSPTEPVAPAVDKPRLAPLWEVDSFAWPVACDKLFRNETGLFAGMSEKLRGVCAGGVKTLAVTGSRRGEGRTTLALCLARAAAQAGLTVALIDADFSRPQVAASLGLDVAYGWHEAAQGKAPLSEAAVRSLKDRVTVLPLDSTAATAGLSWNDPRVTAAVRAVAAAFDLTIVDLGPLPSDARLFPDGEKCPFDGALVVRDVRYSSLAESQHVGERLYECGVSAVGVAENFVK